MCAKTEAFFLKGGKTVPNNNTITLKQDNGTDLTFTGHLFSECSWFDEGLGEMVKQKLYITDTNEQIYYIVRSNQEEKSHHAYRFSVKGENCTIYNGKETICLQFDALMEAVRCIAGIEEGDILSQGELDEMVEERRKIVMNG